MKVLDSQEETRTTQRERGRRLESGNEETAEKEAAGF